MLRRLVPVWLLALGTTTALADTPTGLTDASGARYGTKREVIRVPGPPDTTEHALVSPIIYLNRCVGGCTLTRGTDDDATQNKAHPLLISAEATFSPFVHSDQVWNDVVKCVKEIYSPYDVQITETRPATGTQYHMAVVAGTSGEAGRPDALGVAIVNNGNCAPRNNGISLTFANSHTPGSSLVNDLCWTIGQESAHSFGLDHSFKWLDGRSTCNDPLTYQSDCGGQRFYRNDTATCGEFSKRECACGSTQNSHAKLLATFGPSMQAPLIPPPTAMVTTPANNAALGAIVAAQAGSKRGVAKVELFINGFKWAEAKGAQFGQNGQPNPASYTLMVPASVPSSKMDITVKAYDDLGAVTESAVVQSYKGNPAGCADASTCAKGQKCEAGKCFWDPPSGELGADCTYNEFCKSMTCNGPEGATICTQSCLPGSADSCPENLECLATSATSGICYTKDEGGGCCSVGEGGSSALVHGGISALLLGLLLRRRRK